jgi:hypothetical protein
MLSSYYYLYLAVVTLSISIYNFDIAALGKQRGCYQIIEMNSNDFKKYIVSQGKLTENKSDPDYVSLYNLHIATIINNFNTTDNLLPLAHYNIAEKQTNIYALFQGLIAIFYIIITLLALIMSFLIAKMSNLVPDDFIEMSKFKRMTACICKTFPLILVIFHIIIFVFICVIWGAFSARYCISSASVDAGIVVAPNKYYDDTFSLNIVTTLLWILIHYFGSMFKDVIYQEPFMYTYSSNKSFSYIMFKKLGP